MNQMSPFGREPVELALEAPFRLARLDVTPAALELRRDSKTWTLEPRVMKVLVALHRSRGHAVSRDDLIDLCWDGRIVGEDSLNRGISQLRKALAAEPAVTIDTIARIGYRLRIEDISEASEPAASPVIASAKSPKKKIAAVAGLALLTGIGVAGTWWYAATPHDWQATSLRALTRDAGAETYPALSPDGQRIVYAAGRRAGAPRDIVLRGTRLGDDEPIQITQTPFDDEFAPAWSPSGDRIAFVRIDGAGRCALVVMTPPSGAERAVGRCSGWPSGLAWRGDDELVFADRISPQFPRRLHLLDIASGRTRPISDPPAEIVGDSSPVISADNRWIAFRRSSALGSDYLYLLDMQSGTERLLTQKGGWKASGIAWGEGGTLLFTGNRGGDFGLWSIDRDGTHEPRRVSLGTVSLGRISSDRAGRQLAVETVRTRTRLIAIAPNGTIRPLTSGNGNDLDPDSAPDGTIAFVSDRGGGYELWTRAPDGRLVRLTQLGASFVYSPRWSPGGRQLVFLAVVDGRTDVYTLRADGSGLRRLTTDGNRKGRVAWLPGSSGFLYTERRSDDWVVMRMAPGGGAAIPVAGTDGIGIIEGHGDRLFGRMGGTRRHVVRLDAESGAPRPGTIEVRGFEGWAVGAEGLIEVRPGSGSAPASLWLLPWQGQPRQIADIVIPERANPRFAANGDIVLPQLVEDESDLMLMSLDR